MRHLLAIFVGGLVITLGTLILVGPEQLASLLMLLVVCTFGIGLIPLILLDWAVGLLVLSFFPSAK